MLPASWRKPEATAALIRYAQKFKSRRLLGHLFTTWGGRKDAVAEYRPMVEGLKLLAPGGR